MGRGQVSSFHQLLKSSESSLGWDEKGLRYNEDRLFRQSLVKALKRKSLKRKSGIVTALADFS